MRPNPRLLALCVPVVVFAAACAEDPEPQVRAVDSRLRAVASCDDLLGALREDAEARVLDEAERLIDSYDDAVSYGGGWLPSGGLDAGGVLEVADASESAPTHFTDTNTQEAGVDEPDFVKTDGSRIFLIHGDEVLVFASWPAEKTKQVDQLAIEGSPFSMFLAGDRLVVYSNVSFVDDGSSGVGTTSPIGVLGVDAAWGVDYPYSYRAFTKITVVDVAANAPTVLSERYVEGWFRDARRHQNIVRTVIESPTWQPQWGGTYPSYWGEDGLVSRDRYVASVHAWLEERLAAIAAQDLDGFLPDELVREGGALVEVAPRCDRFYAPMPGQTRYGMAQVLTTDLEDLGAPGGLFVLGHPSVVYSSADMLVLAQENWSWATFGSLAEHSTIVHAFALQGASTTYVGSGAVAGGVRDQFSIDEHEGVVRIALTEEVYEPTEPNVWVPPSTRNRIVTLRPEGGALVEAGRTPDMAVGERIFSVRYVGDRGYVVTFRQVDPLFVVDLSDPAAPEVLGEVEIPGFSTYMHPLSDTHLLTIGQYIDPVTLASEGMQLQMFDVSDPTAPSQLHARVVGGYSAAQYDHKAFVFDPVTDLLAVPVDRYSSSFASTLELFHVSIAEGFPERGSVDHSGLFDECQSTIGADYYYACPYTASMRRGIFIDAYVYAISYGGLTVHALDDVSTALVEADLPAPEFYQYYPYFEL